MVGPRAGEKPVSARCWSDRRASYHPPVSAPMSLERTKPARRRVLRGLAIVAITTLVSAGVAEVALRRWYPVDSNFTELDARRIYRPRPGARVAFIPAPGTGTRR